MTPLSGSSDCDKHNQEDCVDCYAEACSATTPDGSGRTVEQPDAAFWAEQWGVALSLAGTLMQTADDLHAAMRGDLGDDPLLGPYDAAGKDHVARVMARRVDNYSEARRALVEYAQSAEADATGAIGRG